MRKWLCRALSAWAAVGIVSPLYAAAPWREARSPHFVVYTRANAEDARRFATQLEQFDAGLRRLHDVAAEPSDTANPLTVYVVDDIGDVRGLCPGCGSVAGFYLARVSGAIAITPRQIGSVLDMNARTILFHEYTHHFQLGFAPFAYPAWFVEGFAEFNATARLDKPGKIGFGIVPEVDVRILHLVNGIPITKLLTASPRDLKPEQISYFYARSWLLTHYLTFEPERAGQLHAFLVALNAGKPGLEAARGAFGDLASLEHDLDGYLRRGRINYFEVRVDDLPADAIRLRDLSLGEQAMLPIRIRSDRGVSKKLALDVAADARILAAPFENDPGAQLALAEAEYDAGNEDAAEAAADRSLKVLPDNFGALLFKGKAQMRRLQKSGSKDPEAWRQVRLQFVKANRIESNAAEPLWLFYACQVAQNGKASENAIAGLRRSFELMPQDGSLRFSLAREDLLAGRRNEGRQLLLPLAFSPHAAPDNQAAKLIALIDSHDEAGLKAALSVPAAEAEAK